MNLSGRTPGGLLVCGRARLAGKDEGRRIFPEKGVGRQQTSLLRLNYNDSEHRIDNDGLYSSTGVYSINSLSAVGHVIMFWR